MSPGSFSARREGNERPGGPATRNSPDALDLQTGTMDLLARAKALAPRLVEIRRDLHRHPELGFREVRTSDLAAREVGAAGFTVRRGVARTGVVAELVSGEGPTVAIRADMDALPIHERNGAPYASEVAGVMHACGHDFHTAGLVGVSQLLREMHDAGALPPARYRLLFQPSEEGCDEEGKSGGMRMVEEGAMEGVDAVVGLHVGAHLPAGKVFLRPGPFFAGSDEVIVTVRGRSAHAARPHEGVDAIALAALGVVAAQQIVSRGISPAANGVVSFGTVQGGSAMNVIADRVVLGGTLRYFDSAVQARLRERLAQVFEGLESMGAEVEVRFHGGYPPVVNDPTVTGWMRDAIAPLVGESGFLDLEPSMEAEDFAFLARAAPGAFLWLGASLPEPRRHHNPDFDVDEKVLPLASAILTRSAAHIAERLGAGKKGS